MTRLINIIAVLVLFSAFGCKHSPAPVRTHSERVLPPSSDMPESPEQGSVPLVDLTILETSVQAAPEDTSLRFTYLTALDRAGKHDEALAQARALGGIQQHNPYQGAAYLTFARIVLDDIPKNDPTRPDLLKEAIDHINVALQTEPGSVPDQIALGRLALETGDKDTALHHLAIAATATEIGYKLRIQMAEIYIEKKDFEKARAHLEMAKPLAQQAGDKAAVSRIDDLMSRAR